MGSAQPVEAVAPQQELPPDFTRNAASPYFCLTTSLISVTSVVLMGSPICKSERWLEVSPPCCACSTRRRGIAKAPAKRWYSLYSEEKCPRAALRPSLRCAVCLGDARAWSWGSQVRTECR